jgi:hypothetical protein
MRFMKLFSSAAVVCTLAVGVTLPAAAATTAVKSAISPTWAGYVVSPPKGQTIASVGVTVMVPKVNCAGSVGASAKSKASPGWHAAFWAGIDGWNVGKKVTNGTVEQDGVIAFCRTRKSAATYRIFYEMYPAGPKIGAAVHAGDPINVIVSVTGGTYNFVIYNLKTGQKLLSNSATCAKRTKCHNATAEVITEAPGGGPDAGNGLADTGTVEYTYAAAGLSGQPPYEDAIPFGSFAALTKLTMSPKGYPQIVRTGTFRRGPDGLTDFDTYWK